LADDLTWRTIPLQQKSLKVNLKSNMKQKEGAGESLFLRFFSPKGSFGASYAGMEITFEIFSWGCGA